MFGGGSRQEIMSTYLSLKTTYGFIPDLQNILTRRGPKWWPNTIRKADSTFCMCRIAKSSMVRQKSFFQVTYSDQRVGSGICPDMFFPARALGDSFASFRVVAPLTSG